MILDLEGKVIVITGAASGVGSAVAARAAAAGAAALVLTDRDAGGLGDTARGMPVPVRTCVADLGELGAPAQVLDTALAAFGRIDGLVNAAASTSRAGLTDGTLDQWEALFAVNARAPFFLMQGAVRDMLARKSVGSIVNILSFNAHCGLPDLALYSASKAALSTLTKNAANAHVADRIRVNGINLGWTATPGEHRMQVEVLGQAADWADTIGAQQPLGRLLTPDEAARLAIFLLCDASAPMTGVAVDLAQSVLGAPA